MSIKKIKLSDGRIAVIDVPDGASDEQIENFTNHLSKMSDEELMHFIDESKNAETYKETKAIKGNFIKDFVDTYPYICLLALIAFIALSHLWEKSENFREVSFNILKLLGFLLLFILVICGVIWAISEGGWLAVIAILLLLLLFKR